MPPLDQLLAGRVQLGLARQGLDQPGQAGHEIPVAEIVQPGCSTRAASRPATVFGGVFAPFDSVMAPPVFDCRFLIGEIEVLARAVARTTGFVRDLVQNRPPGTKRGAACVKMKHECAVQRRRDEEERVVAGIAIPAVDAYSEACRAGPSLSRDSHSRQSVELHGWRTGPTRKFISSRPAS